jgi:molybdenum cofactor cytidylyltransferase
MQYQINQCGILILAAGQSNRLGRPKQLLKYNGSPFIKRVTELAIATGSSPVVLVLGAYADQIQSELTMNGIYVLINAHWQEGMASSIREGLNELIRLNENIDGLVVVVCDQPYLTTKHINELIQLQAQKDLPAAACSYEGILGTPALFHKSLFGQLLNLQGDIGAKKILSTLKEQIALVEFESGIFDIDTESDYNTLLQDKKNDI